MSERLACGNTEGAGPTWQNRRVIEIADLFCGAGGTSTGAVSAAMALGFNPRLTAVNHWPTAVKTHASNHPHARHICASVDSLNPREVMAGRKLDLLWASPECVHHSRARGGTPMSEQSRASGHCVTRWAEALLPSVILVENVPEFIEWGPLGASGRPLKRNRGKTFTAWIRMLESLGYRVDWRILCAADYGDPTTRRRLFVQAVRGRRCIVWPEPTHRKGCGSHPWRAAREIIDWSLPSTSIFSRSRPLAGNTLRRIQAGLQRFGLAPYIVAWDHQSGSGLWSSDAPLSTVTTKARHGIVQPFLIKLRGTSENHIERSSASLGEPLPTITAGGNHHGLVQPYLVKYYGSGIGQPVTAPLDTVTTKPRVGLVEPELMVDGELCRLDIRFRMLQPHELAAAQGFPVDYKFSGTKADVVKQIGNAVPCGLSRALVSAVLRVHGGDS